MVTIETSLKLRSGLVLPNRLVKAAMTEAMADDFSRPSKEICNLYEAWSAGGTGTLITGNVQIDRRYQERPGNVCIDGPQDEEQCEHLRRWATACKKHGSKAIVQLSHAGRQANTQISWSCRSPGNVPMASPHSMPPWAAKMFVSIPEAFKKEEVAALPEKFAAAAEVCKRTGFDGIQLHSAHGYLLSSFLNPLANNRPELFGEKDPYGGPLENRARLLLECVRAVRKKTGSDFSISVKLNSADFQAGGFTTEEAVQVSSWLEKEQIDFLEISGGNYESGIYGAADTGKKRQSTVQREAYFLEYAKEVTKVVKDIPIMVTGGFRLKDTMNSALANKECDLIGLGRPLCGDPAASQKLLNNSITELPRYETSVVVGNWLGRLLLQWLLPRMVHAVKLGGVQCWYYRSMYAIATTGSPKHKLGAFFCFLWNMIREGKLAKNLKGVNSKGLAHSPN